MLSVVEARCGGVGDMHPIVGPPHYPSTMLSKISYPHLTSFA
jgi:hypothetical protein